MFILTKRILPSPTKDTDKQASLRLRTSVHAGACPRPFDVCEDNCDSRTQAMNNWGIKPSDCLNFCQDLML